jgi:hypothetical protein
LHLGYSGNSGNSGNSENSGKGDFEAGAEATGVAQTMVI